ncbi:protein-export chaperone SecB [Paracoccus sp. (in: a-proteobacteria)]|uniref:protein-export chaperone SecB n=1 Tax=Paracoccus sp. TaxID=267 RepID=UPI0026DF6DC6|nr:protein-export chaperone SecB [Paracoccus sp. (in: a-proteobacteria)]MDO5368816.1 protein-export chaperone SecB [Paracoccus sp. (in: a-proteobacteria)]
MTDETTNGAASGAAAPPAQPGQPAVRLNILAQFTRDLSFENIVAQKGLGGDVSPEIQVQVSLDARKRQVEHQYEVICKYRVTSQNASDKAKLFLCELDYAGVFHIEGVPEEQMHPFLMIECPRMLFPFVRRILSDVTRDGGFPPFNLDPIDFVALYRQEAARRAQAEAQSGAERPQGQPLS